MGRVRDVIWTVSTGRGLPPVPGDVQSLFYALPEAATFHDKRLFTVREGDEIVGVIDAVLRHPSPRACSVGLFLLAL